MINPTYQNPEITGQLADYFSSQTPPSATLSEFFNPVALHHMVKEMRDMSYNRENQPASHRYGIASLPEKLEELFGSDEFTSIISDILTRDIGRITGQSYQFQWKDYTVLHDERISRPGIDLIVDLTPTWQDRLGGLVIYLDQEGQSFVISSNYGSITLVERSEDLQFFVKYVNHYAQDLDRYLVLAGVHD